MAAGKGADFLARRVGADAIVIAELMEQIDAKDARIAQLEALLTPKQREKLDRKE